MKRCPNPDCPSSQLKRDFYDDDTVCPRCGEVLVNPTLVGGSVPADYTAYTGTARAAQPVSTSTHGLSLLGAVATILLVFFIIGLLRAGGMIGLGTARRPVGTAGGDVLVVPPVQATAAARATATALRQGTPVGGLSGSGLPPIGSTGTGAAVSSLPTLVPLPTPPGGYSPVGNPGVIGGVSGGTGSTSGPTAGGNVGTGSGSYGGSGPGSPQSGGGTGNAGTGSGLTGTKPGNGAMTVTGMLCRQTLQAGRLCEATTSYGPSDVFALAVQATFGADAARFIRVHLYGPPDGTVSLLTDQTNTPGRAGRYWVGFAFQQGKPWTVGRYRADIFVNDNPQATTYVTWDVR